MKGNQMLVGLILVVLGPLAGIGGTIWSISGSFAALKTNESAGIGAVGVGLQSAIVFSIAGIVATIVGAILIIRAIRRSNRE